MVVVGSGAGALLCFPKWYGVSFEGEMNRMVEQMGGASAGANAFAATEGTFTSGAVCKPNPCQEESGICNGEVLDYELMDGICSQQRPMGFVTGQSIGHGQIISQCRQLLDVEVADPPSGQVIVNI